MNDSTREAVRVLAETLLGFGALSGVEYIHSAAQTVLEQITKKAPRASVLSSLQHCLYALAEKTFEGPMQSAYVGLTAAVATLVDGIEREDPDTYARACFLVSESAILLDGIEKKPAPEPLEALVGEALVEAKVLALGAADNTLAEACDRTWACFQANKERLHGSTLRNFFHEVCERLMEHSAVRRPDVDAFSAMTSTLEQIQMAFYYEPGHRMQGLHLRTARRGLGQVRRHIEAAQKGEEPPPAQETAAAGRKAAVRAYVRGMIDFYQGRTTRPPFNDMANAISTGGLPERWVV